MASFRYTAFALVVLSSYFLAQLGASSKLKSSPFESALDKLQNQTGYTFKNIGYLRRAMTHPSFSQENNKALSILGSNVMDTSVSMYYLGQDIEISSKDLNRRISENSKGDTSCAADGMRLGLHKVVRVSPKTDSTAPAGFAMLSGRYLGLLLWIPRKLMMLALCFGRFMAVRLEERWLCERALFSLFIEHVC